MKFKIGETVFVKLDITAKATITDTLTKPEVQLYQVEVLQGKHERVKMWFAEHELLSEDELYLEKYRQP